GNIAPPGAGGDGLRAALAAATPLTPGVSRQGALSQPYQFDVYRLSLPAGGSLSVATAGGTDTYGYLFDANGKLLDQVDDIVAPRSPTDPRANLNFRIDNTLSAGTYYVAVEGFSNNTRGPYALSAKFSGQSGGGGGGAMDLLLSIALLTGLSGALCQRARQRTHARWAANAAAPPAAP
ncbi:MAG: DVUA0089 family protein, partial [Gammaproteobacteria bacterium]